MNLPNAITVARIALAPFFVVAAYRDSTAGAVVAFLLFLVASLSDFVDGYLARRSGVITRFGEFLDPLADKLLVGAALWVLVDARGFPLWAALVVAARELVIQILRIRVVNAGGTLPASRFAKLKTVFQIVMVSWWLLPWTEPNFVHWGLMIATIFVTVASGVEYFTARKRAGVALEG